MVGGILNPTYARAWPRLMQKSKSSVAWNLQFDSASSLQRAWSPAMDVLAYITEVVATPRLADFMYKCHWNLHTSVIPPLLSIGVSHCQTQKRFSIASSDPDRIPMRLYFGCRTCSSRGDMRPGQRFCAVRAPDCVWRLEPTQNPAGQGPYHLKAHYM